MFWLLAEEMAKRGHEIVAVSSDAISPKRRADSLQEQLIPGVSVIRFRNRFQRLSVRLGPAFFRPIGMRQALRSLVNDADVVHMGERAIHNLWTAEACATTGIPLVWSPYGGLAPATGVRGAYRVILRSVFRRRVVPSVSRFVAQSKHEAQACRLYGAAADRIQEIPLCVDPSALDAGLHSGQFRSRYAIPDDAPLIVCVARLHRTKGIDTLLRGFARLDSKRKAPVLAVVGWDEGILGALKSLARSLGVDARVIFTGGLYGNDRLSAYRDADVFALTSRFFEETSLAALEAAASGTPTLVTAQCEIPGLADAGGGILVEGNADAIALGLERLLTQPTLRAEIGRRGREFVRQNLTAEIVARQHVKLFEELAPTAPGPSTSASLTA